MIDGISIWDLYDEDEALMMVPPHVQPNLESIEKGLAPENVIMKKVFGSLEN